VVGLTIRDIEESLELVGSLDADRDVEIQSRVSGQIRSLVVDVGDTIVIGQELLRIDASEQRELVRQSEAAKKVSIAEQRAQELRVSAAKLEHKRQEDLRRQGVGTAQQLEASRSKLEIAKAELRLSMSKVDQAESALEGSRLAVAERRIESPLSGRVAARMVQVGDMAKSDLGLLRIVDLSTVRTTLHVGERDYRSLRTGQVAEVRVDGFPEEVFVGHVERMAPVLDPQTRTAVVYVAVDNDQGGIWALHPETGEVLFQWVLGDNVARTPVFSGDRLYFGSHDRNLYGIHSASADLFTGVCEVVEENE